MNTCRANRNVGNKVGIYSQLCFAGCIFGAEMLLGPREGRRRPPPWNHWNAWHGAKGTIRELRTKNSFKLGGFLTEMAPLLPLNDTVKTAKML